MPSRTDLALAAALSAYAIVEGLLIDAPGWWFAVTLPATVALAWRRRFVIGVIALTVAAILAPGVIDSDSAPDSVTPLPLGIVISYTAGREMHSGRSAAVLALGIAAVLAVGFAVFAGENTIAEDLVALVVIGGGAALAGHLMRVRRSENLDLRRHAAEQEQRARRAVSEERARMARELHDIVAHSVSLIAVQAAAAEELLGRDEQRARASLRAVQDTARGALGEMRRLLSVLRDTGDDAAGLAPQPGLDALRELVVQARTGGLPVTLHEEGRRPELPAGLDLSAYRIVQEALTNVRKHAGAAPTDVRLRYSGGDLVLEVTNDLRGDALAVAADSGGHGLPGMRERTRIYGGTLEAGRENGRFVVRARLPVAEGPA